MAPWGLPSNWHDMSWEEQREWLRLDAERWDAEVKQWLAENPTTPQEQERELPSVEQFVEMDLPASAEESGALTILAQVGFFFLFIVGVGLLAILAATLGSLLALPALVAIIALLANWDKVKGALREQR